MTELNGYKGIYFNEEPGTKFSDKATGAHFEFLDMCRRLTIASDNRNKIDAKTDWSFLDLVTRESESQISKQVPQEKQAFVKTKKQEEETCILLNQIKEKKSRNNGIGLQQGFATGIQNSVPKSQENIHKSVDHGYFRKFPNNKFIRGYDNGNPNNYLPPPGNENVPMPPQGSFIKNQLMGVVGSLRKHSKDRNSSSIRQKAEMELLSATGGKMHQGLVLGLPQNGRHFERNYSIKHTNSYQQRGNTTQMGEHPPDISTEGNHSFERGTNGNPQKYMNYMPKQPTISLKRMEVKNKVTKNQIAHHNPSSGCLPMVNNNNSVINNKQLGTMEIMNNGEEGLDGKVHSGIWRAEAVAAAMRGSKVASAFGLHHQDAKHGFGPDVDVVMGSGKERSWGGTTTNKAAHSAGKELGTCNAKSDLYGDLLDSPNIALKRGVISRNNHKSTAGIDPGANPSFRGDFNKNIKGSLGGNWGQGYSRNLDIMRSKNKRKTTFTGETREKIYKQIPAQNKVGLRLGGFHLQPSLSTRK